MFIMENMPKTFLLFFLGVRIEKGSADGELETTFERRIEGNVIS